MKMVIYKDLGVYYVATEDNFQNARKIKRREDCKNADDVIEYICNYFCSKYAKYAVYNAEHKPYGCNDNPLGRLTMSAGNSWASHHTLNDDNHSDTPNFVDEIIEFCCTHFGSKPEDFIIIGE